VPLAADRVEEVCDVDQQATGTPRGRLICALYGERPEMVAASSSDGVIAGYATWRPGRRASQIGPAVALASQTGAALLDQVLQRCPSGRVFADIPTDNIEAIHWAESRSFTVQREFTRMYRGRPVADFPQQIWAGSGPEKG
jgi:hypothetical protein